MMVCLSHQSTIALMDGVCEGHDEKVHDWVDALSSKLEVPSQAEVKDEQGITCNTAVYNYYVYHFG